MSLRLIDLPDRLPAACDRPDIIDRAETMAALLFDAAENTDATGRIPDKIMAAITASGLTLAPFPQHLGGSGLGDPQRSADLFAVLRLIGSGDLSVARLFEGHVNAVTLVTRYGTPDQLADLAEAVHRGAWSAVWNAEGRRPLIAIEARDGWRLDGEKILASGAGFITRPIVTPKTAEGTIMLLATLDAAIPVDLSGWTPQGMRASATGTVDLTGHDVVANAEIGRPGDYMRQPAFSGGAWRFCAVHLGAAERLLDLFRRHLVERGRDGDPYQQQRIALATAATTSAAFWIKQAASLVAEEEGDAQTVVAFANLTRMVTERAALDVLELVHRGIGLGAFIRPHPVERISRDLATYLRQPVPDAAMADAARVILASDRPARHLWSAGP